MMSVLEFVRNWSNVLLFLVNASITALIWIVRRSVATKEDVGAVSSAVGSLERRVVSLEQARDMAPSREDLARLQVEMERVRGDMKTFTAVLEGARDTFDAQMSSHLALVERTERTVAIVTEHLLAAKR